MIFPNCWSKYRNIFFYLFRAHTCQTCSLSFSASWFFFWETNENIVTVKWASMHSGGLQNRSQHTLGHASIYWCSIADKKENFIFFFFFFMFIVSTALDYFFLLNSEQHGTNKKKKKIFGGNKKLNLSPHCTTWIIFTI